MVNWLVLGMKYINYLRKYYVIYVIGKFLNFRVGNLIWVFMMRIIVFWLCFLIKKNLGFFENIFVVLLYVIIMNGVFKFFLNGFEVIYKVGELYIEGKEIFRFFRVRYFELTLIFVD